MLAGHLNLAGVRPADMPLAENTDYTPFLAAGIPIGGITTGSSQRKTEVQARLWGGQAGVAFDPNYHTAARHHRQHRPATRWRSWGPPVAFAVGTLRAVDRRCQRRARRGTSGTGIRLSHPRDELVDAVLVGGQRTRPRMR